MDATGISIEHSGDDDLYKMVQDAFWHLDAAASQIVPSDDQIIAEHVRSALGSVRLMHKLLFFRQPLDGPDAYDTAIIRAAEELRSDMRHIHGISGFVTCGVMAYSTGSPARWDAHFYASELKAEAADCAMALDAIDALRDAIVEKLAARPSLEALAATLGCEVPRKEEV